MLAFPMQLQLMTDGSFPFPAIGLVHIVNEIVQRRPIRATEELQVKVWATNLREHPRGQQFDLRSEVRSSGELVWEETSTNLKRGKRNEDAAKEPEPPSAEDLSPTATWELGGDLGRRYGRVSGDLNPIHMHPLSARLFGFPSAIAHGMWTKARCLAALEAELPDRFTVKAAFRKPIILPTKVQFGEQQSATGIQFGVLSEKGDSHLDGELTFG
jgi:acyl dehydratase